MEKKVALITGITGQDGAYLASFSSGGFHGGGFMMVTRGLCGKRLRRCRRAWRCARIVLAALTGTAAMPAAALPWADPGDVRLRHDIELLRDEGVLAVPVTTWPLSWPDLVLALQRAGAVDLGAPANAAFIRLRRAGRMAARRGWSPPTVSLRGDADPVDYRWFADTPRERGEIRGQVGWLGDRTVARLRLAMVAGPDDGRRVRLDGSYLGATFGNWMISLGAQPRWWGPGWEGSLILSTNARPVPALAIQRKHSEPFRWPVLKWLGPWTLVFFTGVLEEARAVPHALLTGLRLSFSPHPTLEIGLSRSAQWGGRGRPRDLDTFLNLMLGRDNRDEIAGGAAREPGNQLGGMDLRWRLPGLPVVTWLQLIGEDEAGGLPSRPIGQVGASLWGRGGMGASWRLWLEFADTAASFLRRQPLFNYAYEHGIYRSGYRYRGRSLGHGIDGDGRLISAGGIWIGPDGRTLSAALRRADINRDGRGAHPLGSAQRRLRAEAAVWYPWRVGIAFSGGIAAERTTSPAAGTATDITVWFELSIRP